MLIDLHLGLDFRICCCYCIKNASIQYVFFLLNLREKNGVQKMNEAKKEMKKKNKIIYSQESQRIRCYQIKKKFKIKMIKCTREKKVFVKINYQEEKKIVLIPKLNYKYT